MEIIGSIFYYIFWAIGWVLWAILNILWWFLSFFIVPLTVAFLVIFFTMRFAYRTRFFKPRIDRYFAKVGERGTNWFKQSIYTLTIMPIQVLLHLIWLVPIHALINLFWSPSWKPLERAVSISRRKKESD